jgi:trigger factor
MQIQETKRDGLTREFQVNVPSEYVDNRYSEIMANISKTIAMPGFRKGKVPLNLIKKRYHNDAVRDVADEIFRNVFKNISEEHAKNGLATFDIDKSLPEPGKNFACNVSCELLPELPSVNFTNIKVEKLELAPTAEEIKEFLAFAQERFGNWEELPEDYRAQSGDSVKAIVSPADPEQMQQASALGLISPEETGEPVYLSTTPTNEGEALGKSDVEKLINSKAGDKITLTHTISPMLQERLKDFPKEIVLDVEIKNIVKRVPHELNDELAKRFGVENVDDLFKEAEKQLQSMYAEEIKSITQRQLLDGLDDNLKMPVPNSLLEKQFNEIWSAHEREHNHHDHTHSDDEKDEFRRIAERRLKLGLFLSGIAKSNNLEPSREELREEIFSRARAYPGQEHRVFEYYKNNQESIEALSSQILERKSLDFILSQATVSSTILSRTSLIERLKQEQKEEE